MMDLSSQCSKNSAYLDVGSARLPCVVRMEGETFAPSSMIYSTKLIYYDSRFGVLYIHPSFFFILLLSNLISINEGILS